MVTREEEDEAVEAYLGARENPFTDTRVAIRRALEAAERVRASVVLTSQGLGVRLSSIAYSAPDVFDAADRLIRGDRPE